MKRLEAEKDVFSVLMEQFWGDAVVMLCWPHSLPTSQGKAQPDSTAAVCGFVGAPAATPLPTAQAAKPVQPALVALRWQKPPPQLPEPTQGQ